MEIAVIGGGIAGLAAALRLRERLGPRAGITIFEQSARLGGKLRTDAFGEGYLEAGAESFLMRDPDGSPSPAAELVRRVGLGDAIRHPATSQAALAVDNALRPIPRGTLMGVPADPASLDGVARPDLDRDRDLGGPLLAPDEDMAVGALVRARFGDEVVDRLVDPLLGGVYAGRADDLSLATTVPALARAARVESTLAAAVRAAMAAGARSAARGAAGGARPVFGTIDGGLSRLVAAVAEAAGARVRLGLPVRSLSRAGGGWRLVVGSTRDPSTVDVDAVVLAVPARPAARLLSEVDRAAAEQVGVLDYASVALVRMAVPEPALPALSGLLVPAVEGYAVKALTIFSTKWDHLRRADGVALLRASVGRYGDTAVLQRTDSELITLARDELGRLLDTVLPEPVTADVVRWGGGLPQYQPGHLGRVAAVRAALAAHPTLAVAGAAYDGVGIPACVRSGEAAAEHLLDSLA
ncbi:protoporphyrinogen oxidase [Rugosimonospora acidiphila]|uniref:Coproporphyrinogen III oxidase n=1 Tax=Rugosimonospora acidiphila TaxID=556531 RepID=A0ABP9RMK8_9ACTN